MELWQYDATDLARLIRTGQASAREAVDSTLKRLHAVNPAINAVVRLLEDEARAAAETADAARARGHALPPLHGVPVTTKVNVDQAGLPTDNGVVPLKDFIAREDSPVVANLKHAGAIVIGRTNAPAFSMRIFSDNALHGRTLNPRDPGVTPGGSSGGAGAATATGIGTIAHGNDIGGSLRWPAHCNGVVTIKPTQGRVPAYNESAAAERPMLAHLMSAQGPLARSVGDVRMALEVMSQRDPRDPWWVAAPLVGPKPKGSIKVALAKLPDDMDVAASVRAALRQAADHLEHSGYRVSETEVPDINGVWQTWCDIITNETALLQEAAMLKVTSPDFHAAWSGIKSKANTLDLLGWMRATAARNTHIRAWQLFLEDFPVVLAPTTVKPTPGPREDTISTERTGELFWNDLRFISAINVLGLPGAVVPVTLHDGQPIGVQLIAGRYREDLALDAAAAIEKRAGMLVPRLWEQMA
jgi:amidase